MPMVDRQKMIKVQGLLWEEHAGAWFSDIGYIEKEGSDWWVTLNETDQHFGPFMNPSQAAKEAYAKAVAPPLLAHRPAPVTSLKIQNAKEYLSSMEARERQREGQVKPTRYPSKAEQRRAARNRWNYRQKQAALVNLEEIQSGKRDRLDPKSFRSK